MPIWSFLTMAARDPSAEQLAEYKHNSKHASVLVNGHGQPIDDKLNTLTIGARGPILLQDTTYIDEIAHFNRERIPERVVNAKGAGAFGYFEVTQDITKYTKASLFNTIGKRTRVAVRFSTLTGELGSADTVRDPRGFAIKFYTDEGNWDLVGNNTPVYFIRDPIFFPSFIHSQKRNPVTHLKDVDMFWDFLSLRPESTHQTMILFSERGIPDGYRCMHGYGAHTYKLVNKKGEAVYCKFHYKTNQKIKNISSDKADLFAARDPDYSTRDLFNSIKIGKCPSWSMYIQVMTFEQAEKHEFNPFDVTKVWSQAQFPLIPVGKLTLNENPKNYFTDVEQIAFSPSHLVPGIEPSPDKVLQGRLFSYPDTQRYRLGANYLQIHVNCPFAKVTNYQRDGPQNIATNYDGSPNYYPNSFNGPKDDVKYKHHLYSITADVGRYNSGDEDNFTQPGLFWRDVLNNDGKERLVQSIATSLMNVSKNIQKRAIDNFARVSDDFGKRLLKKVTAPVSKPSPSARSTLSARTTFSAKTTINAKPTPSVKSMQSVKSMPSVRSMPSPKSTPSTKSMPSSKSSLSSKPSGTVRLGLKK